MTTILNLENGVQQALRAYKLEQGLSEADVDAWVSSHLDAGVTRVRGILEQPQYRRDPHAAARAAFIDLKTWAQS